MKNVGAAMNRLLLKFEDYYPNDIRLPNVICSSCRIAVYSADTDTKLNQIKLPSYSKFSFPKNSVSTGKCLVCDCSLCVSSREHGFDYVNKLKRLKSKSKAIKRERRCSDCYSLISRGKSHTCNNSSKLDNIKHQINNSLSPKSKQHLVSELLKDSSAIDSVNIMVGTCRL